MAEKASAADAIADALDYLSFNDMKLVETKIGGPIAAGDPAKMVDLMRWVYYCLAKRADPTMTEDQAGDATLTDLQRLVETLTGGKDR